MSDPEQQMKIVIDGTLGGGGLSAPWWVQQVDVYVGVLLAIGGVVLLGLRIAISWRELKGRKS